MDGEPAHCQVLVVIAQDAGARLQKLTPRESPVDGSVSEVLDGDREWEEPFTIRGLLANARCSQAVLEPLTSTDVRRRVPAPAEENAQSEALEWEPRERQEREGGRRWEAEELGAVAEEKPLFLPRPSFMASASAELRRLAFLLCFVFPS